MPQILPSVFFHRRRRRRFPKWVPEAPIGGAGGTQKWRRRHPNVVPKEPKYGAEGAQMGRRRSSNMAPKTPKCGAGGATPPEGKENPAVGGCFASLYSNTLLDGSVTL